MYAEHTAEGLWGATRAQARNQGEHSIAAFTGACRRSLHV
jgi:hypothetical protein